MSRTVTLSAALCTLLLAACSGTTESPAADAGSEAPDDGGSATDAGEPDAGAEVDAGTPAPSPYETGLTFRARFDGSTTDVGPQARDVAVGASTATYVADRHGVAGMAAAMGTCLQYGAWTNDGSTGAFTFAAWIRTQDGFSDASRQTIGAHGGGFFQTYFNAYPIGYEVTTEVYETTGGGRAPTFWKTSEPGLTIPADTWTHLAFVFTTTGGGTWYVNGAAIASIAGQVVEVIQTSTNALYVGCGGDAVFKAHFDEFALWGRALTATEIAALAAE